MTYNANQHQNEGPPSPSTDAGDDDHSMTTSSGSFEEIYSPYENTSRQLSPTSDTSFTTFGYSLPFCNYGQGRPGEIGGQINITQNVYTHDGSINYELLVPRDTRLPSQEISSPELFDAWPIPGTEYYVSQTEALSPCSIPESSTYQLAPPNNYNKGDECEKEPKR
ncbi:uncharacterized protein H6S33_009434 [Morchella sextelata]|uniref:uncharacterized protein n=1 Tax=Morchella sextelata TaxID=1174677 RepID=UPI001D03A11A|nr:uncharacterized protein H6S33_009434 [Morchella sextelata]KAH0613054.1 hypothetical protein H6S33_009434 [Morchella sextelata]